jgi:chemotaxis protein CheC
MEHKLNDIEKDIIKEIFSFGLAKTADSLSVISKETVFLNIPGIQILELEDIASYIRDLESDASIIRSSIVGDIDGETLLVFNEDQANRLALICIGNPDKFEGNYLALKRSLLLELGNILTGALVTQLANILNVRILGTPPEVISGAKKTNFKFDPARLKTSRPLVLTVNTEFVNSDTVIEMPFIIIFEMSTVDRILEIIRIKSNMEANMFGSGQPA